MILKNLKIGSIIFLILFILFLVMGSISASEDTLSSFSLDSSNAIVDEVDAESSSNAIEENIDENILENNNDDKNSISESSSLNKEFESSVTESSSLNKEFEVSVSEGSSLTNVVDGSADGSSLSIVDESTYSNEKDSSNLLGSSKLIQSTSDSNSDVKNTLSTAKTYDSYTINYSPSKAYYTTKYITYKVKVQKIFNYAGKKYGEPIIGANVTLKVYTGTKYKVFSNIISLKNYGIFSYKLTNLGLGTHKVEILIDGIKRVTTSLKVVKSKTKVLAPSKSVKLKKKTKYYIRVFDSLNVPVKKIYLKVKVYTGKKYKTYNIKTNKNGLAYFKTNKLAKGKHKAVITTKNKKYKVKKTTYIKVLKNLTSKAQTLKVSAPSKTVKYKQSTYFNIKVLNAYNFAVKKLYIKVKVFTGKKSKTYTIKTNKKGIAKLQTKNFAVGKHKITISTKNKKYKISKSTSIKVNKTMASNPSLGATTLYSVLYYQEGNDYKAKLTWNSKKGAEYLILRKTNAGYQAISKVKASSTQMSYTNTFSKDTLYTYTVGQVINSNGNNILGPYDKEGLKLIERPKITVDFQNLKAIVTWDKVADASKYRLFRKMGRNSDYNCIAILDANNTNYTDVYLESRDELKSILNNRTFADPSFNSLFYTVRGCNVIKVNGSTKTSYGLYYPDGDFHLEAPSIVSLNSSSISWGRVPTAQGYIVLARKNLTDSWVEIGRLAQKSSTTISMALNGIDKEAYYTVKAYASKNGAIIYSKFDEGFTLRNHKDEYSNYSILYFGDSITYGSPYKSDASRHIFSIPNRVEALIGGTFYNPSIPGSTYYDFGIDPETGKNYEKSNYYRYRICREVVDPIAIGELPENWEDLDTAYNSKGETKTKIADYNIVVLAAGTNDYIDNATLGDLDSDDTSTFHGALNHIMEQILNASLERIAEGKEAIKVVFVDLYYSDRTYDITERNNRDITPNRIGLTLMDYQKALNETYERWEDLTKDLEDPTKNNLTFYKFDTRSYGIVDEENSPYTASDNLHFTKYTYGQYGNAFAQFLVDEVFDQAEEPDESGA